MKKLNLNKKVIARLNNPEQIYGGEKYTVSCTLACCLQVDTGALQDTLAGGCNSLASCTGEGNVCDSEGFTCISGPNYSCPGNDYSCIIC